MTCTHQIGEEQRFLCSHPLMKLPGDTAWLGICNVCPNNDHGVRVVNPKVIDGQPIPNSAVGEFLKLIFLNIGIYPDGFCPCDDTRILMNQWGPQGCREHLDEICESIYAEYEKWKIGKRGLIFQQAAIAAKLLAMGIIVNPLDPIRSIVLEAIKRAESAKPP